MWPAEVWDAIIPAWSRDFEWCNLAGVLWRMKCWVCGWWEPKSQICPQGCWAGFRCGIQSLYKSMNRHPWFSDHVLLALLGLQLLHPYSWLIFFPAKGSINAGYLLLRVPVCSVTIKQGKAGWKKQEIAQRLQYGKACTETLLPASCHLVSKAWSCSHFMLSAKRKRNLLFGSGDVIWGERRGF